jgi:DNA-binding NarL/FixJ family response regulator
MPEQEGIETIRMLHRVRPGLKIIAMSGQFAGALLEAPERFGAKASIRKPIQPDALLDAVARVLVR